MLSADAWTARRAASLAEAGLVGLKGALLRTVLALPSSCTLLALEVGVASIVPRRPQATAATQAAVYDV